VGSAGPEQTTTIKVTCTQNTICDAETFNTNVTITGAGDFTRSGGTCSGQIFAIQSDMTGTTCTIEVTFAPVAPGARSATLTPGAAFSGQVQSVALSGAGIALPVTAAPPPIPTSTVVHRKCKKRHRAATAKKCKKKH
jgi:hypothetical protein